MSWSIANLAYLICRLMLLTFLPFANDHLHYLQTVHTNNVIIYDTLNVDKNVITF